MIACLDIGGTSIKVAICDKDGNLFSKDTLFVKHETNEFINSIVEWIEEMKKEYKLEGVAISAPGPVNVKEGVVKGSCALPCINDIKWKEVIKEKTGLNASIENDGNCAALAEVFNGSGKDYKDILFIVCGTGIGGAIIKDGKVHYGKNLYGGEFGFMIMEEQDGEYKIFSEVASTMSFVRKVREHYNDDTWTGEKVFEEANKGNQVCIEAIETFYLNLAKGILSLQHIYDPELILLGGAISNREDFVDKINQKLNEVRSKIKFDTLMPQINTCTHKKDANLIGALANYLNEY